MYCQECKSALETDLISYEGSPEFLYEYIHLEDAARASVDALKKNFVMSIFW